MTSRERVIAAIRFANPDRIPVDIWTVPAALKRHGARLEGLLEEHPIDFFHPNWPTKWDPENLDPRFMVGTCTDEWGVVWVNRNEGYCGMDTGHPLADWSRLENFRAPAVERLAVPHNDTDRFYLVVDCSFFHRMCWLRGMEAVLMDLMDDSPEIHRLREILIEYYARYLRRLAETDADGIAFMDDWGSQTSLLIPPGIWRSFFKPVYRDLFGICREAGKFIFFHSDGYILEIIEDLIELGVDALNSQVWCMGPEVLGERFRGRIAFWGEINRQTTLPHGTPAEVRDAAARMRQLLATPAGGLIGQGEIDSLTPLENVEALLTAWD